MLTTAPGLLVLKCSARRRIRTWRSSYIPTSICRREIRRSNFRPVSTCCSSTPSANILRGLLLLLMMVVATTLLVTAAVVLLTLLIVVVGGVVVGVVMLPCLRDMNSDRFPGSAASGSSSPATDCAPTSDDINGPASNTASASHSPPATALHEKVWNRCQITDQLTATI